MPLSPSPPNLNPQDPESLETPLVPFLGRLHPSPETIVLILALLVGSGTGLGVLTFRYLILVCQGLFQTSLTSPNLPLGPWPLAIAPILGAGWLGLMHRFCHEFSPSLTALIIALPSGQILSPWRPIAKTIAAAISLGAGASLGPEGPSVEVGANFGILLGQTLKLSQARQRLLLGAGAAAGLAAGFNAPIAGVFFALEVVLGTTFETSAASVVVLAAVVSALITQIGLGTQPAFDLPAYEVRSPLELPLYLGLGLLACGVSIAYTRALKWMQAVFQAEAKGFAWMKRIPRPWHPLLGGLCVAGVALQFPQIMGVGYETVEAMLRDAQFSLLLLIGLLGAKLLMTAISLGSGFVGGVFAPAMFLGASLGAAYGKVLPLILPMFAVHIAAPPAYAMVGMAAVLAASVHAPLTSVLLLFEMTRDYRIVLPLMAAVGLSVWLMDRISPKEGDPKADPPVPQAANGLVKGSGLVTSSSSTSSI